MSFLYVCEANLAIYWQLGQPGLQGLRCCHNTLQAHACFWRIHFLCHFISCCASCLPATLASQNPSLHPSVVSALETCAPRSSSKFQMWVTPASPSGVYLGILPAMLEKSLWHGQEAGKSCLGLASPAGQGVDAKPVQRRKQGGTQPSLWTAQSRCAKSRSAPGYCAYLCLRDSCTFSFLHSYRSSCFSHPPFFFWFGFVVVEFLLAINNMFREKHILQPQFSPL